MKLVFQIAAAVAIGGISVPLAQAHEFWIDGKVIEQEVDTVLTLDIKVGQMLDGMSLPYIPETIESFEWVFGGQGPVSGVIGDIPAAQVPFDPVLGAVIFHRTAPRKLLHRDWDKFLEYLDMEGLNGIAEAHAARGLPQTGFVETYTRHAKFVMIPPNGPAVVDRYLGSPLEIVLDGVQGDEENVVIHGQLVGDTRPKAQQVSVFSNGSKGVAVQRVTPNEDGAFSFAISRSGSVLINAVTMSPASSPEASWHSDWASMFIRFR